MSNITNNQALSITCDFVNPVHNSLFLSHVLTDTSLAVLSQSSQMSTGTLYCVDAISQTQICTTFTSALIGD